MKKGAYVGLILLFFFLLAAAGLVSLFLIDVGGTAVDIPARGYLDIQLAGAVSEVAPPDFISTLFFGTKPLAVHDLWMNLRKAKVDDRIPVINRVLKDGANALQLRPPSSDRRKPRFIDESSRHRPKVTNPPVPDPVARRTQ